MSARRGNVSLPALGPLRHWQDVQSLAYLAAQPALMAWQWHHGFQPALFLLTLFLAVGISVIHHNHAHLTLWRQRGFNRATDLWLTGLQGQPTCVFQLAHNANHHRYRHGPDDVTRTWRFGDSNHFPGWLWHPLQATAVVYPFMWQSLREMKLRAPAAYGWCRWQYLIWTGLWALLLIADPRKALVLVIVPQLVGLHWLLGANYLQHAHANDASRMDYARNFEGLINPLLFNIGLHTAHHEHGRAHWSELPALHRRYRALIDPRLVERSFAAYVLRTFVFGTIHPRYRSHSLRARPYPGASSYKDS